MAVQNPCEKCKRAKCPEPCRPRQDYRRALQKRFRKAMKEKQEALKNERASGM